MAFTRYCLTSRLLCTNQSSVQCPLPPAFRALLQYHHTSIAQYATPPTTSRLYAIHHTILARTVSCKCQGAPPHRYRTSFILRYRVSRLGIYTMLPFTILYGIYCNAWWSRGNHILRKRVCDEGGEWGAQTKAEFAKHSIDSCTQASKQTNIS